MGANEHTAAATAAKTATTPPVATYQTLRPRFKQRQAETNNVYQNWQIRVHRALSWLKRAEELPEELPDLKFVLLWVALNALYSRWDGERNAPAHEASARGRFIARVCAMDENAIGDLLGRHRLHPVAGYFEPASSSVAVQVEVHAR